MTIRHDSKVQHNVRVEWADLLALLRLPPEARLDTPIEFENGFPRKLEFYWFDGHTSSGREVIKP